MSEVSEKKRLANRANAAKSTGPKTAAGKAKVSLNALKHGTFAKTLLLPGEDADLFEHFQKGFIARLNPRDPLELHLVQRIIADAWRIQRLEQVESRHLHNLLIEAKNNNPAEEYEPDPIAASSRLYTNSWQFDNLQRLRVQLANSMNKAIAQLQTLQKQAIQEPSELCQELDGNQEPNGTDKATDECNCSKDEQLTAEGTPMNTDDEDESRESEPVLMTPQTAGQRSRDLSP